MSASKQTIAAKKAAAAAQSSAAKAQKALNQLEAEFTGTVGDSRRRRALVRSAIREKDHKTLRALGEDDVVRYLMSLLDPFGVKGARIPMRAPVATSVFSSEQTITVNPLTISTGRVACVCLKGGLLDWVAFTNRNISAADGVHEYFDVNLNALNFYPTDNVGAGGFLTQAMIAEDGTPGALLPTGTLCLQQCVANPQYEAILSAYSAYRIVSMGMKITYTGAALGATGELVVCRWPGVFGLKFPNRATSNFGPNPDQGWTFDQASTVLGAETFSVTECVGTPITLTWVPDGDSCDMWKSTKYLPTFINAFSTGNRLGSNGPPPANKADPQYRAEIDMSLMIDAAVLDIGTRLVPPVANLSRLTNEILYRYAVGCDPALPQLFFLAVGLATDAQFKVDIVVNYEGIADARSWNLVVGDTHSSGISNAGAEHARMVAKVVPAAHKGDHVDFLAKMSGVLKKAWSVGKAAGKAVHAAAPTLQQIAGKAGYGELADAFGQVADVESIADVAALFI